MQKCLKKISNLNVGVLGRGASDFGDIFDTSYFIASLRSSVQIIHELPSSLLQKIQEGSLHVYYMHPSSWSNESYYLNQVWIDDIKNP
jgi:hypothetical protein